MSVRKKSSTTRLPQTLRDELEGVPGNDHSRTRYPSKPKISRKEARKEQRQNRKKSKSQYFSAGNANKRNAEQEEHDESPQRKKAKLGLHDVVPKPKPTPETKSPKVKKLAEKVTPKSVTPRTLPRIPDQKRDDDDAYIAYLEAKLGYAKGVKRKKPVEDDDLLDFADTLVDPRDEPGVDLNNVDDDVDDEFSDGLGDMVDEDLESQRSGSDDLEYDDDEWDGLDCAGGGEVSNVPEPPLTVQENTTRYVPPHLRNKQNATDKPSESMIRLSKQLKGLLNR
ncbi:hypothetical protein C0989_003498 [Termitomyces sp. Mn162]|nr:hypothetical protein C0989_003498 [Termitomyces sp. Mn162]